MFFCFNQLYPKITKFFFSPAVDPAINNSKRNRFLWKIRNFYIFYDKLAPSKIIVIEYYYKVLRNSIKTHFDITF